MLLSLKLSRFKNFREAELGLGPFTVIVGTNASGKSNIRDAFRFLHGISRGYAFAEIIGEKYVEGGVLQWKGIRGGTREVAFREASSFSLEADFDTESGRMSYAIEVDVGRNGSPPKVVRERLILVGQGGPIFDSHPDGTPLPATDPFHIAVRLRKEAKKGFLGPTLNVINERPVLSQIPDHPKVRLAKVKSWTEQALGAFRPMRFLDLSPDAMRNPSFPGQTILGDRGENLSSVLQAICEKPEDKKALVAWVRELTPLDASDFDFPSDQTGRVLVTLVEQGGQRTSAYSASDGTLRFLAMIAALLGPQPATFYFFEELENGIHPTRLHLLLQLIESRVAKSKTQIVATSHSPQLLGLLSAKSRESAAMTYRDTRHADARIQRILDIPEAKRVLEERDWARLLGSGWLENAVALTDEPALAK